MNKNGEEALKTEDKILKAAHKVFSEKGFAATGTRDIAEAAGTNLALLNYYFGSKEKLFKEVVHQKFQVMLGAMVPVLADETIALPEKIKIIVNNYTNLLLEDEALPIFILNALSVNRNIFEEVMQYARSLAQPVIEKQITESNLNITMPDLIVNTISLSIFPFVARLLIVSSGLVKEDEFEIYVTERQEKIVDWILNQNYKHR